MPSTIMTYLALSMEEFQETDELAEECPFEKGTDAFLHWPGDILPKGYTLTVGEWEAMVMDGHVGIKAGTVITYCELNEAQVTTLLKDSEARLKFYSDLADEGWIKDPD